jgi:hypothetical protein
LAIPGAPFTGTEKDGELLWSHAKKDPVSCDVWLDPGTLRYLRDKTFEEGASVHEIMFNTGQKIIISWVIFQRKERALKRKELIHLCLPQKKGKLDSR